MSSTLVCSLRLTDSAHMLFWQTKTMGRSFTPAKFSASCQKPSDVEPSPENAMAMKLFFFILLARATPVAILSCAAMVEEGVMTLRGAYPMCAGEERPLSGLLLRA